MWSREGNGRYLGKAEGARVRSAPSLRTKISSLGKCPARTTPVNHSARPRRTAAVAARPQMVGSDATTLSLSYCCWHHSAQLLAGLCRVSFGRLSRFLSSPRGVIGRHARRDLRVPADHP
jgi:hypothetical protein